MEEFEGIRDGFPKGRSYLKKRKKERQTDKPWVKALNNCWMEDFAF